MPKMSHWNSQKPVDVSPEKVAVYQAQGWVVTSKPAAPKVEAVTVVSLEEAPVAPKPAKKAAAKRAPANKAAKKS